MYLVRFGFRSTGVDAADTAIFAIRNPVAATKRIYVRKLVWGVGFDGATPGAAASVGYALNRFSGADPTGGTSPARIRVPWSSGLASGVADANIKTGAALTLAGTHEEYFHEMVVPAVQGALSREVIDFLFPLALLPGEGLACRTLLATIAGTRAGGSVWYDEE